MQRRVVRSKSFEATDFSSAAMRRLTNEVSFATRLMLPSLISETKMLQQ